MFPPARLRTLQRAAVALALVAFLATGRAVLADGTTGAGTVVSNRAEATYVDSDGTGFSTVSPTVTVTVLAVAALAVTPDETEPSATVGPNERVTRLFRVCNTGNTPDLYTITAAEVSAPAQILSLHFDADASGTLTDADRLINLGLTMSPRLARAECAGVVALLDTGASAQGSHLTVKVTARSNVSDVAVGARSQDLGTIINVVGSGARLTSPSDSRLPPVKLVEGLDRFTAARGQALVYSIAFRNTGDVTARRVVLGDDLPDGLEYVAGSLRLEGRPLTDAEDGDEGSFRNRRLEVRLGDVKVDELVQVTFQARVAAGVAPGTGIVNTALVSADNALSAASTTATAIVNPFGVVFQGRGGGGAVVPGARVTLFADAAGQRLQLAPDTGSEPNEKNDNPFAADGQGRFSFALAPEQIGSAQTSARYFLNVTAAGYRSRMIEATVAPSPSGAGLFTLSLRALDGQPIAKAGSFELTEEAVEIPRLAAFALNVPLFENSALEITKIADRPTAEVGDVISYRVEVHNATAAALDDAVVRDTLPPSFHYAAGSALLTVPPDPQRSVEPEESAGGVLTFRLGRVPAGARAALVYRVRIGANAREGEQLNTAAAAGVLTNGEQLQTAPARAGVRVRRGVFSTQQTIVGRVFEDANSNGLFDKGERPLAGVRLYINNGQSVITDSAGQYNFPAVNDGSIVISLDPVTLPPGYALSNAGRRDQMSWTRLLRTPLQGGALLRQNYALLPPPGGVAGAAPNAPASGAANGFAPDGQSKQSKVTGALFGGAKDDENKAGRASAGAGGPANGAGAGGANGTNGTHGANGLNGSNGVGGSRQQLASGTYEMTSTESVEPVAPGAVRVVSPTEGQVVAGAALEVEARVAEGWTVALEVGGARVPDSQIGERRVDRRNSIASFTFVGLNLRPGPNKIRATAVGPDGATGQSVELVAYGRGPAKRLEVVTDKSELSAGGRDRTTVRVRAFDQWNHPAADTAVLLQVSRGRLLAEAGREGKPAAAQQGETQTGVTVGEVGDEANDGFAGAQAQPSDTGQQVVTLKGGEGILQLVSDSSTGAAEIRATTGTLEALSQVRVTPEVRPSILVGVAEVSVGQAAPENSLRETDESFRSRIAFFYRGQFLGQNLLTLAYDSERALNRTAGRDRLFQLDPLERAYPLFGDSSTRYEDAPSNSKLYARVDRGRSYLMFGDFDTENQSAGLAGYNRRLTGVKLHVENSRGDFVSVTGARPDTAFARDVFPGGAFGLVRLSHADVLPGSEAVYLEVRDRRNPELILSREALIRSVDYNLDTTSGTIFFLRPLSTFDFALNLVQVVVTYEHRADNMSSAVYTARAVKKFEGAGLRVGLSLVDQRQADLGSFIIGGVDAEKTLPQGGRLRAEWAMSRGEVAISGNLFGDSTDTRHDGNAYRVELEQPLPYREARLRASYTRADAGFLNPFGATVTPGSRRAEASVEMKLRRSSSLRLGLMDERNRTSRVSNSRQTFSASLTESLTDRLRFQLGYDFRRYRDDLSGTGTDSNLLTAGAEWQATDKLQLSVKREQNLGEADPTYPDQTTLAANYQYNQFTRLFFTQRLASAPIIPISDAGATGFASTGARRETAIGVETRLGRYTSVAGRYQIENGINGTDSFAVIGLQNRLPLSKQLALDFGYERGVHLAGAGESFNNFHLGYAWQPTQNFRTSGRYELRDRGGLGSVLTFGAAGRLRDNLTTLARLQFSRSSYAGRDNSSATMTAALAWRPVESDGAGLLLSYTRRDLSQTGGGALTGLTRDRSDTLSSDGYYQLTSDVELYGRFALKFGDTETPELARVSTLTYLSQGRVVYRLGRAFDTAAEVRMLLQPASATRRTSFGAELGYWVLADLRLGGGYNWTGVSEPFGSPFVRSRRGFYFTVSSKLSNLFDLFGTSRDGLQPGDEAGAGAGATEQKKEEEDDEEEER